MPALRELQSAMARALLDGSTLGPEQDIYRNTCLCTLTGALATSYPAVRRLVGEDFFEGAAREFICSHPPASAYLNEYGEAFAAFLAQFPQTAALAYLADVARLEWAVNRALHAADLVPIALGELAALDPAQVPALSFVPHPAVTALQLQTPADEIWRAVLAQDQAAIAALDPVGGPVWLLIDRGSAGVQVRRMARGGWRFTELLCMRRPLQAALADPQAQLQPVEELNVVLADHLASGRFIQWDLHTHRGSS
jgi:Putative DNA-binding domain